VIRIVSKPNKFDSNELFKSQVIYEPVRCAVLKNGGLPIGILGEVEVGVNSIHTFFAKEEDVNGLEISAYSDDGFVEAVELKDRRFCLGVKWHPELMLDDIKMKRIFERFIKVCGNC